MIKAGLERVVDFKTNNVFEFYWKYAKLAPDHGYVIFLDLRRYAFFRNEFFYVVESNLNSHFKYYEWVDHGEASTENLNLITGTINDC